MSNEDNAKADSGFLLKMAELQMRLWRWKLRENIDDIEMAFLKHQPSGTIETVVTHFCPTDSALGYLK